MQTAVSTAPKVAHLASMALMWHLAGMQDIVLHRSLIYGSLVDTASRHLLSASGMSYLLISTSYTVE